MWKIARSYSALSDNISETIYIKDPSTFASINNPQRTHHQKVERRQSREHDVRVREKERDIRAALWKN